MQHDAEDHCFFSVWASPVHYILCSMPSSTATIDGDCSSRHGADAAGGGIKFFAARTDDDMSPPRTSCGCWGPSRRPTCWRERISRGGCRRLRSDSAQWSRRRRTGRRRLD
jgi:hypothetical protein